MRWARVFPLLAAIFAAGPAGAEGDTAAGRKLAETHCARCHVVGDFNPMGGIGSTPSFQLLAKRADWRERFETFFERRPHPVFVKMPDVERWTKLPPHVVPFEVTLENLEDIVAFIATLAPR